ncbi:MAG: response regulator [Desulfocapsaceae bacterium]|nr:response regulator [Desulfocapsaceae bacterium]
MKKDTRKSLEQLRRRAERALESTEFTDKSNVLGYVENYIHELQVNQIELEMQAEELRRTQDELMASRNEYAELYHKAPVGYLTITTKGMVEKVNNTFIEKLKVDPARILKKPLSRFIIEQDHSLFFTICQKAHHSPQLRSCELNFINQDNEIFSGRVDIMPIVNENTDEQQLILSIIDITEQKEAEQEKNRLERELVSTQKIDSIRRLAGGIAHNFNNILTSVIGNLEIIRQRELREKKETELVTNAYQSALKAADLGLMMLHYLGHNTAQVKTLDLEDSVKNLFGIYRRTVHGRLQMLYEPEDGPIYIQGDPVQIAQIVNNLTTNSVEAIGDSEGVVRIRLIQTIIKDGNAPLAYNGEKIRPGKYVCMEVSDTGGGMGKEVLEIVGTPFFTTKLAGRGLGISAVLGIVAAHGGYFMINSEPNQGTTASVYLPLFEPFLPEEAKKLEEHKDIAPVGKKVLCIDDDKNVRTVIRTILENLGCEVLEAEGGQSGIDVFAKHQDDIAFVLLDFVMPDLDGNLTLIELRKIRPDIPVLLVSAYLKDQLDKVFNEEKPDGFLQKPFDRNGFLSAIENLAMVSQERQ